MILVADSGSTKTDWRLLLPTKSGNLSKSDGTSKSGVAPKNDSASKSGGACCRHDASCSADELATVALATSGINPYFLTEDEIAALLLNELCPQFQASNADVTASDVREIYFYGAGVATPEKSAMLVSALKTAFPSAQRVEAYSDLLGTARGFCGTESGIVGIIGTGSNSCYYDGQTIVDNVPPCGFILGDEGSGAVLGRKLLSAFLKRDLSEALCEKLRFEYGLSKEIILERVYRQPFPNRFLAQHARFLADNISEPVIKSIVTQTFEEFFDRNVLKYAQCCEVPIHLTGSIAYHFANVLREVAATRHVVIGKILKSPIDGIVSYHRHIALPGKN